MKKTTKFLLVLAAVVAMTIGAMSTVMAADVLIGKWNGNDKDGWTAVDTEGNAINSGWAKQEDTGLWYYFESGKMVKNTFVTSKGKIYFLGGDGAMCTGWVNFKEDTAVRYNKVNYDNVEDAFPADDTFDTVWVDKKPYKTLWCCFDENGAMYVDSWVEVEGLWYYMKGAFCLMSEWSEELPDANGSTKKAFYGFGGNGNMHVGWIEIKKDDNKAAEGKGPYEKPEEKNKVTDVWVYYGSNGKQAKAGWNKIDGNWFYFMADTTRGWVAVTNSIVNDGNYNFLFDADGYMVTGAYTFPAKSTITYRDAAGAVTSSVKLGDKETRTFIFDTTKGMITGLASSGYYYEAADVEGGNTYKKFAVVTSGTAITADTTETAKIGIGEKVTGDFFLTIKDKDNNVKAYYFEDGKMVKNTTLTFSDVTIAIDDKGVIQGAGVDENKDVTVDSVKYYFHSNYGTFTIDGIDYKGVSTKKVS